MHAAGSFRRFAAAVALVATGCSGPTGFGGGVAGLQVRAAASQAPIPCSALSSIRALHSQIAYVRNAATGDTLEYLVIGDGALTKDVLVMFPGTGQIMTGWPVQMITNSTYSPKIVHTYGYKKREDGSVSLCHDYRLVLFDYPGVGGSPYAANATHDRVARDVDAMLEAVSKGYGISTDTIDPVGWSLGTTYALKYAFLSPAARPSRTIHNVLLVSGHGGGSIGGTVGSGSGACVTTLLNAAIDASGSTATTIKGDASKLIFPYQGQKPTQNGTNSGCTATVSNGSVTLSVALECTLANNCKPFLVNALASFVTHPWSVTKGIDSDVYTQQREESGDWNVAYCAKAGQNFTSLECSANGTVQQSVTNGGVCQTDTSNPNAPVAKKCDALAISGKVHLVDGYEDLFVQWRYDKALVDGLNAARPGLATFTIYKGSAGHGILIQHPGWTQAQLQAAM
jgi:pimeloyl-ACP methyl ester carboxylesterase